MTDNNFINELAKKAGITTDEAENLLSHFAEQLSAEIKEGNSVVMQGFGVFEVKERSAKKVYNPSIKDYKCFPASKVLAFRPSTLLKDKINQSK